jgi:hypothetical protein
VSIVHGPIVLTSTTGNGAAHRDMAVRATLRSISGCGWYLPVC